MTKDEAMKLALAEQPAYRAVKTYHEGKPVYVAEQPAQQEPVDATEIAARILTHLGFSQDESIHPGADRRRDAVAMMIENAALREAKAASTSPQPLTISEISKFVGTFEYGPEQLKWFRLGEAAHGIKENT